jgi:hypothetical protein
MAKDPGAQKRTRKKAPAETRPSTRAKAREGKKALVGYFSEELNRTMHELSDREERSMQSLIGESVDLLLQNRGIEPLGER